MDYNEKMENVSILGAAGKMGSGIVLLTIVEMADLSLKAENKSKTYVLNAVDISQKALSGLMKYINAQVVKIAEKKIVQLRKIYEDRADLIENSDIINEYVLDVMNILRPVTTLESTYESNLIFEAASENPDLKAKFLEEFYHQNPKQ